MLVYNLHFLRVPMICIRIFKLYTSVMYIIITFWTLTPTRSFFRCLHRCGIGWRRLTPKISAQLSSAFYRLPRQGEGVGVGVAMPVAMTPATFSHAVKAPVAGTRRRRDRTLSSQRNVRELLSVDETRASIAWLPSSVQLFSEAVLWFCFGNLFFEG